MKDSLNVPVWQMPPIPVPVQPMTILYDVSGDGKEGLQEAIHALQVVSRTKTMIVTQNGQCSLLPMPVHIMTYHRKIHSTKQFMVRYLLI